MPSSLWKSFNTFHETKDCHFVETSIENIVEFEKCYLTMFPIDFGLVKTLKSRIRISAVNFVKETLVGLPAVPTEEELEKLKANRKKEAEKKIAEEKLKAQEAKIKFEQQHVQQQVRKQRMHFRDNP